MDTCYSCGDKTEPEWDSCEACGAVLEDAVSDQTIAQTAAAGSASGTASPKVELISRGWDVVEVDPAGLPADPIGDDEDIAIGPLPPDAIEIAEGDIAVIHTEDPSAAASPPVDAWDHLRPHGDLPPLQRRVSLPARSTQVVVTIAALAALAAAGLHFFVNTRLDAIAAGAAPAGDIEDLDSAATISLAVVAGLIVVAGAVFAWWAIRARREAPLRLGKAGLVTLVSLLAGVGLAGASVAFADTSVTEAIAANSLAVLGLGLVMMAGVIAVRTVARIDRREPA